MDGVFSRTVEDILSVFSHIEKEEPIISSFFWRVILVILCVVGTIIGFRTTIRGLELSLGTSAVHYSVLMGISILSTTFLLLSKQIWLNRIGGGTFLFVFFGIVWIISWLLNVLLISWVFRTSFTMDSIHVGDANLLGHLVTAGTIREVLSIGAAIVLSTPPILLTLFVSFERVRGLPLTRREIESVDRSRDQDGNSSLMKATIAGDTKAIIQILTERSDIDERNNEGWTPLMMAASHNYVEAVKVLVERGADKGAETEEGNTSLMIAAERGNVATVRALLEGRNHVNHRNHEDVTPLMLAVDGNHLDVVNLLVKAGAITTSQSKTGDTPLKLARRKGNPEIIKSLGGSPSFPWKWF